MKKIKNKESFNVTYKRNPLLHSFLLGILLIILGTILYTIWSKQQVNSNYTNRIFVVKELGIEFSEPVDLKDLTYIISKDHTSGTYGDAFLSTKELIENGCFTKDAPLGEIDRYSVRPAYFENVDGKKIGKFYYIYVAPQYACSNNVQVNNLQTKQISEIWKAFKSVKSIQY